MGCKVILTPRAIEDLRGVVEFIKADNPVRAASFGEELIDRALAVGELPKAGRIVPEIGDPQVREVIHQAYRIVYKISADGRIIYVVRFWHSARGEPEVIPKS